jgi:hypothetical protein
VSVNGPSNTGGVDGRDPAALAGSLSQLTSGWTAAPGVPPEALTAAREALAASLIAGKNLQDIHAVRHPLRAAPPANPQLEAELARIATGAATAPPPQTMAVIRSATAATLANPTGRPAWTLGAQVLQSYGPFLDLQGVAHWVDLILFTRSVQFAFSSAASAFGVLPVRGILILPPHPSHLTLGAGSVWFLADLLSASLPAGNFTGFTVTGGHLTSSAAMDLQGGVYVIPPGATLTAVLNLAPAPGPIGPGGAGPDAAAATFTPPAQVTIEFRQSGAAFTAVADSSAGAYGTKVDLRWNHNPPSAVSGPPQVLVPCDPAPGSFAFTTVKSSLFAPSGSAPITQAGWVLPLAATAISSLPEAAGPGSALIEFGPGASIRTSVQPQAVPVTRGLLEIATGGLFAMVSGKAKPATTVYQLWPLAPPSKFNATLEFATLKQFALTFLSTPSEELLAAAGDATAHLDRPEDATGARFPYTAGALLLQAHTATADRLFLLAARPDVPKPIFPVALTNVLLGVDAPAVLVVEGVLNGLAVQPAVVALYFNLRWLLPTLPDPYAANFDLSVVPQEPPPTAGTVLAVTVWRGGDPQLGFTLLPPPQSAGAASVFAAAPQANIASVGRTAGGMSLALLDLSTRVDLFGVALAPEIGRLANSGGDLAGQAGAAQPSTPAPAVALAGLSLEMNSALIATFALPQCSWEPMESTAEPPGPIYCDPASDGSPLLVCSPDYQKLVPFSPGPVLLRNIASVASGHPFAAVFSLPFGLNAVIIEPNRHIVTKFGTFSSSFHFHGGEFRTNIPHFPESFVPNPPAGTPELAGALQLTLKPTFPYGTSALFHGSTLLDTSHGPHIGPAPNGYGYTVVGAVSGVGTMFETQFGSGGGVPLRRIDFSGYGASIFSEWFKPGETVGIVKVQFETSIGRTAYEVIQAVSVIYPYCIHVVRTITMGRQNAGWVKRTDTGWQAASPGQFQFPPDIAAQWANAVHPGAFAGAFNVRNIRDQAGIINTPSGYQFRKVLFDADLGVNPSLNVLDGGFSAPVPGVSNPPVLVASRDLVGWVQIEPLVPPGNSPDPSTMQQLFDQAGEFTPSIACSVEAGASNNLPGTKLRCSAFEVNMVPAANGGPALGVALRGAPQIPRGGGWSLGRRAFTDPSPSALPADFPLPLVQPAASATFWYLADVADLLQLASPNNFYSLMHSTGTHKVLFETPQIPTAAAAPGIQFPKLAGPPKPGGVPINPGSPNLGDIASILNSTGLFPDVANVISLLQGAIEQIDTIGAGFHYSKSLTLDAGAGFDPNKTYTLADLGIINIALQYADISLNTADSLYPVTPTTLTYTVDSAASPSWSLNIGPLSLLVTVPLFSNNPLLMITGGFYADEHTNAGLTNLNVQMGDALSVVKSVFNDLQSLAQYLPGGAGAQLNVALSDGKLTVSDTFSIAHLPLGLGNLTDVSLNLGLTVTLQPLSVDFAVGIGSPNHPFNWIVDPLAGNGLMTFGVQANQPAFTIQAGLGLGLAIDLGIASGSASITLAFQLAVNGNTITLMAILTGQASVDVLDGLASASLTLSAALGFSLSPIVPPIQFTPAPPALPPTSVTLGPETITLLASCSVGIHISIAWVVSVSWDGSWQFSQSVTTPSITLSV